MTFRATIEQSGKTATGIPVPAEVVEALGAGKRVPVRVTLGGYTYRTTVAPYNGAYMIPLSAEHRAAAGVEAGQAVDVGIEVDTEPRTVEVPADFAKALKANTAARARFDALAYSHQRRWVLSIEDAKTPETRARRIAKAIEELGGG